MFKQVKLTAIILFLTVFLVLSGCGSQKIESREMNFSSNSNGIVKAMTFNIRTGTAWWDAFNNWNNRKQLVIDTIAKNKADVIGLQEGLNYQIEQIQKGLPQYEKYAVGRNDGKKDGETCAIFYRKDRFTKLDSGTFWFSETPSEAGSKYWMSIFPRICSWVHLVDTASNKGFYVYNVHLACLSQSAREKSVRLLAEKITGRRTNDPFIVTGDFNMELDNDAMKYLQNIGKRNPHPSMYDAWASANPGKRIIGTTHQFTGSDSGPKIDHIPISENIKAIEAVVDRYAWDGRYPSDHFPVTAILQIF